MGYTKPRDGYHPKGEEMSSQATIFVAAIILAAAIAYAGSQLKSSEISGGMLYSPPEGQHGVFRP